MCSAWMQQNATKISGLVMLSKCQSIMSLYPSVNLGVVSFSCVCFCMGAKICTLLSCISVDMSSKMNPSSLFPVFEQAFFVVVAV